MHLATKHCGQSHIKTTAIWGADSFSHAYLIIVKLRCRDYGNFCCIFINDVYDSSFFTFLSCYTPG